MPIKLQHDPEPTLNLTAMIDIVFLLIIFFMAATKFAEMERQIRLEVPSVSKNGVTLTAPAKQTIQVQRDNTIVMDGQSLTPSQLVTKLRELKQQQATLSVLIRADHQGMVQGLATVMGACREAGCDRIGMAVRAETERR